MVQLLSSGQRSAMSLLPRWSKCCPRVCCAYVATLVFAAAAPTLVAEDRESNPAEVQVDAPPLITSIQQYWNLTPEQKSRPVHLRLECDVTYSDTSG